MKQFKIKASLKSGGFVDTVVTANSLADAKKVAARMLNCTEAEIVGAWEVKL